MFRDSTFKIMFSLTPHLLITYMGKAGLSYKMSSKYLVDYKIR